MKTIKKLFCPLSLLLLLTISFSCKENDPAEKADQYASVNNWIQENMEFYYLWNSQIPTVTNKSLNPKDYFNSLLYTKEDRFSWIQENFTDLLESISGVETEAGYNFMLMRVSQTSRDIVGIINYIKLNSPASNTRLKRGDLFHTVNGTKLTMDNYGELLNALSFPHKLGIIDLHLNPVEEISLSVTKYAENPVLLDTVYKIDGKQIGYLVYNFFAEDDGDKTGTYAKELNAIFGKLKSTGIDELILDFRYNGGGALSACAQLSSMIANKTRNDLFGLMQYNPTLDPLLKKQDGADYNKIYFADYIKNIPINKLTNLNRLFVITSGGTASASEFLINGLKAYMEVILIGEVTYGKNVGSITIYETDPVKQKTNKWGMQPIIIKLADAKGNSNFGNGFTPNVQISEYEHLPLLPLGDTDETMLNAALVKMNVMQAAPSLRAVRENPFTPVFSSVDRTPARKNMYINPEILRKK